MRNHGYRGRTVSRNNNTWRSLSWWGCVVLYLPGLLSFPSLESREAEKLHHTLILLTHVSHMHTHSSVGAGKQSTRWSSISPIWALHSTLKAAWLYSSATGPLICCKEKREWDSSHEFLPHLSSSPSQLPVARAGNLLPSWLNYPAEVEPSNQTLLQRMKYMQTLPKHLTKQNPFGISQRWIKSTPDNITVCSSLEYLCLLWSCCFSAAYEGFAYAAAAGCNSRLCASASLILLSWGLGPNQVFLGTVIKYYSEKKCVASQRLRCRCECSSSSAGFPLSWASLHRYCP